MKLVPSFFAILLGLVGVSAWAQDSLAGAERFTAADGGRVAYDKGVLTVQGQFITSEVNVSNPPSVDSGVLATISGKPVMKQATWKGQTTSVAAKFSASKDTYSVGGTPYVIISAGPQTAAGFTSVGSVRFINMATRAVIAQGGNLNPGFVISGTDKKTVLVRAVGPGLAALGVANTMADPIVTVYSGQTVIGSNDNWSANATQQAALESAFVAAGAFKLTAGSKDAALLLTLAPGNYTAVAKGADNGGGELIVEVYEVP